MSTPRRHSSPASSSQSKRSEKAATPPSIPSQVPAPQPAPDDRDGWKAHWAAKGQPWRTEQEIDTKRQKELDQRRTIIPDVKQCIYPFKDMKLSRADVEWLLATFNDQRPVSQTYDSQYEHDGLDLRGANLCHVDLSNLPLNYSLWGLTWQGWVDATSKQRHEATAHLEGTNFKKAQLREASFVEVHLKDIYFDEAHLEGAYFGWGHLTRVSFFKAHLENANLFGSNLKNTYFGETHSENANFGGCHFENVLLLNPRMENANFGEAHLENLSFSGVHLENADLYKANLKNTDLSRAHLEGAVFDDAVLVDEKHVGPCLADVYWNNVNLTVIDWSQVDMLGDEDQAMQLEYFDTKDKKKKRKNLKTRLDEHVIANRANLQLAVALQSQGLSGAAARFAYRAQVLERRTFWFQMTQPQLRIKPRLQAVGAWLFSWFLFLIAGYGYRPSHSFLAYFLVISGFATAYYFLGHAVGPALSPLRAFVFSMTSFHGRGFFPGNNISLDDPLTVFAAFEALVGLIIEVTFIATLTQRFFNR